MPAACDLLNVLPTRHAKNYVALWLRVMADQIEDFAVHVNVCSRLLDSNHVCADRSLGTMQLITKGQGWEAHLSNACPAAVLETEPCCVSR